MQGAFTDVNAGRPSIPQILLFTEHVLVKLGNSLKGRKLSAIETPEQVLVPRESKQVYNNLAVAIHFNKSNVKKTVVTNQTAEASTIFLRSICLDLINIPGEQNLKTKWLG